MAIFEVSSRDKRVIKTMENVNYGMENTNNNTENINDGKENINDNIGKK